MDSKGKTWINFQSENQKFYQDVKNINFIEVAVQEFGYEVLKDKSYHKNTGNLSPITTAKGTFYHVALAKTTYEGKQRSTQDIVLVQRNTGGDYWYRNPNDPSRDSGDLLNFFKNRSLNKTFPEICNHLRQYMGQSPIETFHIPPVLEQTMTTRPEATAKPLTDFQFFHDLRPLTSPEYLQARGLTIETLTNPIFSNRIFNSGEITTAQGRTSNIAFPYYDASGIVGVEYKNASQDAPFSGFKRDSTRTAWLSKLNPVFSPIAPIDRLIVSEAVIDSLSYHQLHQEKLEGQNVLHFSSGGSLHVEQLHFLQKILDLRQTNQIILIHDNDVKGHTYDLAIAGALPVAGEQCLKKVEIALSPYNRSARTTFHLASTDPQELAAQKERIENFYTLNHGEDQLSIQSNYQGASALIIEVGHRPSIGLIAATTAFVLKEKGLNNEIAIQKALGLDGKECKDWNEVLMNEKGLSKNDIYKNMELLKKENKGFLKGLVNKDQKVDDTDLQNSLFEKSKENIDKVKQLLAKVDNEIRDSGKDREEDKKELLKKVDNFFIQKPQNNDIRNKIQSEEKTLKIEIVKDEEVDKKQLENKVDGTEQNDQNDQDDEKKVRKQQHKKI